MRFSTARSVMLASEHYTPYSTEVPPESEYRMDKAVRYFYVSTKFLLLVVVYEHGHPPEGLVVDVEPLSVAAAIPILIPVL